MVGASFRSNTVDSNPEIIEYLLSLVFTFTGNDSKYDLQNWPNTVDVCLFKGGRLDNIKRLLELGADIQQLEFMTDGRRFISQQGIQVQKLSSIYFHWE